MTELVRSMTTAMRFDFDFKTYGPFLALLALIILGTLVNPAFVSEANMTNMLTRSAFIGIIAVGATFVITAGGIDLSVGSMAAFIAGIMIIIMNTLLGTLGVGWLTILTGMALSVVIGFAAGMINGLVTTRGKIEAFIVTLGTMGIYRSLVTYFADGGTLSLDFSIREIYRPIYYDAVLGIPYPVLAFALVAVAGYVVLNKTRFGRHCFAIGSNEHVAKYV